MCTVNLFNECFRLRRIAQSLDFKQMKTDVHLSFLFNLTESDGGLKKKKKKLATISAYR